MSTFMKLGVAGVPRRFSALALAALATLALAGCSAERPRDDVEDDAAVTVSEAIVRGAPDRGRHPAVVAVLTGDALCTGVVLAKDVVLTARHCVAAVRVDAVECPAREPQVGRHVVASSVAIHVGDDVRAAPPVAFGRAIHAPASDAICDDDVALVTLDRPLEGVTPLRLSRRRARVGDRVVAVGYGQVGDRGRSGVRRFRTDVVVTRTTPGELTVSESTCSGDSGGPAIDEASGEVVGILSRGSGRCAGVSAWNVYVQTAAHLDLFARILGDSPEGAPVLAATDVGDPCVMASSCASGLCVTAEPASYCSRPCGPEIGRCPNGFRCARRTGVSAGVCARKA